MARLSIERQEARLAFWLLLPAFFIVISIVIFPVAMNFWISFKPVRLGDLRPPRPLVREQARQIDVDGQSSVSIRYRLRNTSAVSAINNIVLTDVLPEQLSPITIPEPFRVEGGAIRADFNQWEPNYSKTFTLYFGMSSINDIDAVIARLENSEPQFRFVADNVLTNLRFTLDNYRVVISDRNFAPTLLNTILYSFGGSIGAIILGLFAALLVNRTFPLRGMVRGLLLFSYITPIIAATFTIVFLLDPISGFINQLLLRYNLIDEPIPFLTSRSSAMPVVILFDAWRYFPFAYLFILSRLQAISKPLYESAQIDGAGNIRQFFAITLPHLKTVIVTIFTLRFIWTFNRFDDIFLLTGGAAGTQTLPIQVYENAIGLGNIGTGASSAVVLFVILVLLLGLVIAKIDRSDA